MTMRKSQNLLLGDRTPAYVSRETGAAELQISPGTWDQWVKEGRLPQPCDTLPAGTPRWRWKDVDLKLSGMMPSDTTAAAMRGALNFGKKTNPRPHCVPASNRRMKCRNTPVTIARLEHGMLLL